jgi:hypothetical protein
VVNGVLVLLDPMALIMDGQSGSYTVECLEEGSLFFYQNIELFSTSKPLPASLAVFHDTLPQLSSHL